MQGTTLMQTLQNSDMVQQYMWGFSPDNQGFVGILVAALIAFLIGYVEQFLSIIMIKKKARFISYAAEYVLFGA